MVLRALWLRALPPRAASDRGCHRGGAAVRPKDPAVAAHLADGAVGVALARRAFRAAGASTDGRRGSGVCCARCAGCPTPVRRGSNALAAVQLLGLRLCCRRTCRSIYHGPCKYPVATARRSGATPDPLARRNKLWALPVPLPAFELLWDRCSRLSHWNNARYAGVRAHAWSSACSRAPNGAVEETDEKDAAFRVRCGAAEISGSGNRGPRDFLICGSGGELFFQNALLEIELAVEQQGHGDVPVLADFDDDDIARFGKVGDGTDRAFIGFERLDLDLRLVRQERTAPPAWAERANRGHREDPGAKRDDRAVRRQIVGGATDRGSDQDAVGHQFVDPNDAVAADPQLCGLPALAQQRDFIEGERASPCAVLVDRCHLERVEHHGLCCGEALLEPVEPIGVHQEADAAAMHAEDWHPL